jgi:branched-chain amino acid transport system permease protein
MKKTGIILVLLILAFLVVWPLVGPEYQVYLTLSFFAYSVALLGLNLLFNYTGLLSFGHALFIGIGGYTVAFFTSKFHIPYMEVSIIVTILLSGTVAMLIGLICVRYIKIYFAMLTLAFGMLFHSFLMKTYHLTGGDEGMSVEQPYLLGMDFSSMDQMAFFAGPYYYYSLAVLILASFAMWRIVHSPFGLCLTSIRDNPAKAEYLGIGIRKYRLVAFIISGCFAGVGGVLLAPVTGHMDPGMVVWTHSGDMVFMILLGGFTNFFGPMLGSVIFITLRDVISSFIEYWRFIFGALLAVIVIFAPGGVMEILTAFFNLIRKKIMAGEGTS